MMNAKRIIYTFLAHFSQECQRLCRGHGSIFSLTLCRLCRQQICEKHWQIHTKQPHVTRYIHILIVFSLQCIHIMLFISDNCRLHIGQVVIALPDFLETIHFLLLLDAGLNISTSHFKRVGGYFTVNALYELLTYLLTYLSIINLLSDNHAYLQRLFTFRNVKECSINVDKVNQCNHCQFRQKQFSQVGRSCAWTEAAQFDFISQLSMPITGWTVVQALC